MGINSSRPIGRSRSRSTCEATAFVHSVLNCIESPIAIKITNHLRKKEWMAILQTEVSPMDYDDAFEFAHDYLAASLLSKFPDFPLGIDTQAVGIEKFKVAEDLCRVTNERLTKPYVSPSPGYTLESYIHTAREKIRNLLGDFSWDDAEEHFGFSGGASTRLPRRKGDAFYKFQGKPETTPNNAELAKCAILRIPGWAQHLTDQFGPNPNDWVKLVIGNRIDTVPKNAKTDRIIAIEPDLNMFVQKGLGKLLRLKLKNVGVNLDSQARNQTLAYLGSIDGSLATLDLSMASDCVSTEFVRMLLPPDWFDAIMACSSRYGVMPDGAIVSYQKVSSMGNGFTFELESLLFWALSASVMSYHAGLDRRLAVYGDDIIVPSNCSLVLTELLEHCGFKLNNEKSFTLGPFRESCGKHFFRGVDVTPFYVRSAIDCTARRIWFLNSLRRWTSRSGGLKFTRFKRVHERRAMQLPYPWCNPLIPDGVGDGALIGTFDEVRPRFESERKPRSSFREGMTLDELNRAAQNLQRYVTEVLTPRTRKTGIDGQPALLRTLMYKGLDVEESTFVKRAWASLDMGFIAESDERPLYSRSKLYTSRWDDAPLWGESLTQ